MTTITCRDLTGSSTTCESRLPCAVGDDAVLNNEPAVADLAWPDRIELLAHELTLGEWVRARKRYGYDGTYSLAFLVTDFLIERASERRLEEPLK
jgi:hypothetical protein